MKTKFLTIVNIIVLSAIIFGVSAWFINSDKLIMGIAVITLSFLCVISLIPFGVKLKSIKPDVWFGIIDNGILAIMAVGGGYFAGIAGAIIGGVVGNSITDGIAGIFEGYSAENLRNNNIEEGRTVLKSAVGKMAGCLLGAGIVLILFGLMGI